MCVVTRSGHLECRHALNWGRDHGYVSYGFCSDSFVAWHWMADHISGVARIASGQPGSIAARIYSKVHRASRPHLDRAGDQRHRQTRARSDGEEEDMRKERKMPKRREFGSSSATERSSSSYHERSHHRQSHSPHRYEYRHDNSHRSQESQESVTTNKYFAFHHSASPRRAKSGLQSQVMTWNTAKQHWLLQATLHCLQVDTWI